MNIDRNHVVCSQFIYKKIIKNIEMFIVEFACDQYALNLYYHESINTNIFVKHQTKSYECFYKTLNYSLYDLNQE